MPELLLEKPLQFGKLAVDKLTFREHTTAADYLNFDIQGGVAQMQSFIADFSGSDIALVRQLSGKDYLRAKRIIDSLLDDDFAFDIAESKKNAEKK